MSGLGSLRLSFLNNLQQKMREFFNRIRTRIVGEDGKMIRCTVLTAIYELSLHYVCGRGRHSMMKWLIQRYEYDYLSKEEFQWW